MLTCNLAEPSGPPLYMHGYEITLSIHASPRIHFLIVECLLTPADFTFKGERLRCVDWHVLIWKSKITLLK
jgi:hypothetical protein